MPKHRVFPLTQIIFSPNLILRNAVNSVNKLLKIKIEIYFQLVIAENINSPNKTVWKF